MPTFMVTVHHDGRPFCCQNRIPSPNDKHVLEVFRSGVKDVKIVHRAGKENDQADVLSRNPLSIQDDGHLELGTQVAQISSAAEEECTTSSFSVKRGHSRRCYINIQLSSDLSGIAICPEFCGHTAVHRMMSPKRSHHSSCLE